MRVFLDAPPDPHWWTPTNREWVRSTLSALFKKYPRAVVSMVVDFGPGPEDPGAVFAARGHAHHAVASTGLCAVIIPINHSLGTEARKIALIRATLEFGAERAILFHGQDGDRTHEMLRGVGLGTSIWRPKPPPVGA
jgi:hypothetical protein